MRISSVGLEPQFGSRSIQRCPERTGLTPHPVKRSRVANLRLAKRTRERSIDLLRRSQTVPRSDQSPGLPNMLNDANALEGKTTRSHFSRTMQFVPSSILDLSMRASNPNFTFGTSMLEQIDAELVRFNDDR